MTGVQTCALPISFLHVPDLSPVVYTDDFPSAVPAPPQTEDEATDKLFHALWTRGETMVVDVATSERSFLDWNPSFFIKEYGQVPCKVASNRTGAEHDSTVGAFFEIFGQKREDPDILKIKVCFHHGCFGSLKVPMLMTTRAGLALGGGLQGRLPLAVRRRAHPFACGRSN